MANDKIGNPKILSLFLTNAEIFIDISIFWWSRHYIIKQIVTYSSLLNISKDNICSKPALIL